MTVKKIISLNQVVSMRFPQTVLWFYYHGKDLCYTLKNIVFLFDDYVDAKIL